MPESFSIYGYRRYQLNVPVHDGSTVQYRTTALTKDGYPTLADASLALMDVVLEHGPTNVSAVIVRLDNGVDVNGERHVIRRLGDAKAWWE